MFRDMFEVPLLDETRLHCELESQRLSLSLAGLDHSRELHTTLAAEIERTWSYLTGESGEKLLALLDGIILAENQNG